MSASPALPGAERLTHPWRLWGRVVLINFLIAATVGAILRFAFVTEISWINYRFWMHAHSHLAMLGWLYGMLFVFIVRVFELPVKRFVLLFWLTQLTALSMFVVFTQVGYAPLSIALTGLHLVLSYVFAVRVIQAIKARGDDHAPSLLFLKGALFFMVLSTVGLWALGPIMGTGHGGTAVYYGAIQFFLHFQLTGWFLFGAMALFLRVLAKKGVVLATRQVRTFFVLLTVSCLMTFALAVTWSTPEKWLFVLNSLGVLIQLGALVVLGQLLRSQLKEIVRVLSLRQQLIWMACLLCFALKILSQSAVAIPSVAVMSYTVHNFVIGFIHLIVLGCMSLFLFGLFEAERLWERGWHLRWLSILLFTVGFALVELLLFYQGIRLWAGAGFIASYYELLAAFSALLPISLVVYLASTFRFRLLRGRIVT